MAGGRTRPLTDEEAQRILIALRAGKTLRPICGGMIGRRYVRSERVADYRSFHAYCRAHPEYGREAKARLAENMKLVNARKGSARRAMTHCRRGHSLTAASVYYDYDSSGLRRGHRKCLICQKQRDQYPKPANEEQVRKVTAALNAGKTIGQICWGRIGDVRVEKPILTFRVLKRYRELNPDFNRFVLAATANNNSKGQQRRYHPAKARIEVIRNETSDYHEIRAMLPANFPDKDDVVSDIFEALLNGSLQREGVRARVKYFIAAHNATYPTKYAKFGDSPLVSLDEVLFDDGTATMGDSVSRGLWD